MPVIALDSSFGSNGASLKDNGTGFGDVTGGPLIQFDPIVDAHGRPIFVQRLSLDFLIPTGKYDEHKDINTSSNFYINFTASYEVLPNISAGVNGYYFRQLTDDKANGSRLEDSREKVLGLRPGLFWKIRDGDGFWFNVYKESGVENRSKDDLLVQLRVAFHL